MSAKLRLACMEEAASTGLEAISVPVPLASQVWFALYRSGEGYFTGFICF